MDTTYEPHELTNQFDRYDELKEETKKTCADEIGDREEVTWDWDYIWDWAQDTYFDFEYDTVEDQVKFADAAYHRVQSNTSDPDWTKVKQRISDFVIPRHVDVQRRGEDMPDYLPGQYTSLATQEIVVHAVTLEIIEDG